MRKRSPDTAELDRPNGARIYDYDLGGDHNTAADRAVAERIRAVAPHAAWVARSNRAFLHRAVRFCLAQGIRQFLDLGSGIPTVGNVHDIAQHHEPRARVVYVDNEPIAVAHTRRLLDGNPQAGIIDADLRMPDDVLRAPETARLLDFDQPIALLLVAALHYVSSEADSLAVLRGYTDRLPPGAHLVFSQATADGRHAEAKAVQDVFGADTSSPLTLRSHDEIRDLIERTGWTLIPPGLVRPPEWRPNPADPIGGTPVQSGSWAGVASIDHSAKPRNRC